MCVAMTRMSPATRMLNNMAAAIEVFEATLLTPNSRFDKYLTGDAKAARLYLLSYGGSRRQQAAGAQQGIRVRVLGRYRPLKVAAYDAPADAALIDVDNPGNATEFTIPPLRTLAIVDLERLK